MADNINLTDEDVKKVASLAKLRLSDDELSRYKEQLLQILDHMNTMNEVNTDSVEPTAQVTGLENVFREDEVQESLPQEKVMELAPESEGGYIKVNAVFSTSE